MRALENAIKQQDEQLALGLLPTQKMADSGLCLVAAVTYGMPNILKKLLPFYDQRTITNSAVLSYAAEQGALDMVEAIIPYVDVSHSNNLALFKSIQHNHISVTQALIGHCDISKEHSVYSCLRQSIENSPEFLRCLLPHYPTQSPAITETFVRAAAIGNMAALKLLAPMANPNYQNCSAIRHALEREDQEMFDFLYPLSDISQLIIFLNDKNQTHPMLQQRLQSEHLNHTLTQALEHKGVSVSGRKM